LTSLISCCLDGPNPADDTTINAKKQIKAAADSLFMAFLSFVKVRAL
jgi:hypothetical protein